MQVFKRHSAAEQYAKGNPILIISGNNERLYVVLEGDMVGIALTEVSVYQPGKATSGNVSVGHLNRLGNANWATPGSRSGNANDDIFPHSKSHRKPATAAAAELAEQVPA